MTAVPGAFLRFSRDRRGYENFYLVHSTTNRRGKTRAHILYWFRTPPGVKVGRLPFDADMQRLIETQNPGVTFDWKRLLATPIPPPAPDVEKWRERRRQDKAERAARRALQSADVEEAPASDAAGVADEASDAEPADIAAAVTPAAPEDGQPAPPSVEPHRKRRRRRRGRRNPGAAAQAPAAENPSGPDEKG